MLKRKNCYRLMEVSELISPVIFFSVLKGCGVRGLVMTEIRRKKLRPSRGGGSQE